MAWTDSLKSLEPWKIWAAASALIVVVVLSYWYFSYSPMQEQIAVLDQKIEKLDTKIRAGQAAKKEYEKFSEEIRSLEAKLDQTIAILPQENAVERIVKQVESLALQSNLEVNLFDPGNKSKKGIYGVQPISLKMFGQYNDLCLFAERVAQEDRIINLNDIGLRQRGGGSKGFSLDVKMTAEIFWFIPRAQLEQQ